MTGNISRDSTWIKREYGSEKWPSILRRISEVDDPLPQAVHRLGRVSDQPAMAAFGRRKAVVPASLTMLGYRGWVAQSVAEHAASADAVIELGAGWGRNLFSAWLAGAPADALYVAGEFTDAGREASRLLAEREPRIEFADAPFNFYEPRLELRPLDHALVFTAHAIEQIPYLPATFPAWVRTLAKTVTVLHFEPIGWQIEGGESAHAEQHDHSRNLWPTLLAAGAKIDDVMVDVVGVNPSNPTSLVRWS